MASRGRSSMPYTLTTNPINPMPAISLPMSAGPLIRKLLIGAFVLSGLLACSGTNAQPISLTPNGQGDYSAVLQHALDSAAMTGSTVSLQPGTYRLAKTIRI